MEAGSVAQYLEKKFNVTLLPTHKFASNSQADKLIISTPIEEVYRFLTSYVYLVTFQLDCFRLHCWHSESQ